MLSQFDLNPNEVEAVRHLQSKPGVFSDIFVKYGTRSLVARSDDVDEGAHELFEELRALEQRIALALDRVNTFG